MKQQSACSRSGREGGKDRAGGRGGEGREGESEAAGEAGAGGQGGWKKQVKGGVRPNFRTEGGGLGGRYLS